MCKSLYVSCNFLRHLSVFTVEGVYSSRAPKGTHLKIIFLSSHLWCPASLCLSFHFFCFFSYWVQTTAANSAITKTAHQKDKTSNSLTSGKSKRTSQSRTFSLPWLSLPLRNQSQPTTVMLEALPAVSPRWALGVFNHRFRVFGLAVPKMSF